MPLILFFTNASKGDSVVLEASSLGNLVLALAVSPNSAITFIAYICASLAILIAGCGEILPLSDTTVNPSVSSCLLALINIE